MTLRKLNMEINFKFASEIIRIFNSDSIEDNMNALTFLDYSSVEEFILIILKNGTNCIIKPQKYSLLHHFIEGYLYCYLSHERYYLLDSLCDDLDKEMLFDFFDTQYDLIRNYDNHNFCYEEEIEALDVAYENSGYDNHKEYKEGLRTLYDTYEEEFTKFIPKIVESVFYILYGNKKLLFNGY